MLFIVNYSGNSNSDTSTESQFSAIYVVCIYKTIIKVHIAVRGMENDESL